MQVGEPPTAGIHQHSTYHHTQKKIWLITYVSATGEQINIQMLQDLGKLNADECHLTTDRVMSYAYIHLTKRARQPAIERFMDAARAKHGITQSDIFGYDAIASTTQGEEETKIEDHIAFKMLVKHAKSDEPSFKPCTDGEAKVTRGLIFKAMGIKQTHSQLERQSKSQLIEYIHRLEQVQIEANEQKQDMLALSQFYQEAVLERSQLRLENAEQKRIIQSLQTQAAQH